MNIAGFLILTILKNICKRLLFIFSDVSRLHGPKGLSSRLYDSVRLRVRIIGLVFVFKLASLVPKQVPTCIRKPKTNAFDKSIKLIHWLFLVVLDEFRPF